jgi:hypothetical protein
MLISRTHLKFTAIIPSVDHIRSFKQIFEDTVPFTSNLKPAIPPTNSNQSFTLQSK